mmetsp:Transcript_17376/g.53991  ORF Transcript_17376/g.53991 Transcript_17376/m.53991 type:complete len:446 (-) Transcript_17376:1080-2417(-)
MPTPSCCRTTASAACATWADVRELPIRLASTRASARLSSGDAVTAMRSAKCAGVRAATIFSPPPSRRATITSRCERVVSSSARRACVDSKGSPRCSAWGDTGGAASAWGAARPDWAGRSPCLLPLARSVSCRPPVPPAPSGRHVASAPEALREEMARTRRAPMDALRAWTWEVESTKWGRACCWGMATETPRAGKAGGRVARGPRCRATTRWGGAPQRSWLGTAPRGLTCRRCVTRVSEPLKVSHACGGASRCSAGGSVASWCASDLRSARRGADASSPEPTTLPTFSSSARRSAAPQHASSSDAPPSGAGLLSTRSMSRVARTWLKDSSMPRTRTVTVSTSSTRARSVRAGDRETRAVCTAMGWSSGTCTGVAAVAVASPCSRARAATERLARSSGSAYERAEEASKTVAGAATTMKGRATVRRSPRPEPERALGARVRSTSTL